MNIILYTLAYCEHCLRLKEGLTELGIDFTDLDADTYYEESLQLEELLSTKSYPILEIEERHYSTFFINESRDAKRISDKVFVTPFSTIDSLLFQIENYIKNNAQ